MQESAVSLGSERAKGSLPLPRLCWKRFCLLVDHGRRPGPWSETKLIRLCVIGRSLGRVTSKRPPGNYDQSTAPIPDYQQTRLAYGGEGALSCEPVIRASAGPRIACWDWT